ncbi:MAG: hypothetical protein AB7E79_13995 [Rhodospirillaceae bacterium]
MSDISSLVSGPPASPAFARARTLSRILSVVFAIGFWVTLLYLVCISLVAIWPEGFERVKSAIKDVAPQTVDFPAGKRLLAIGIVATATVPILGVFESARRAFRGLANGDVFSLATIGALRTTAIWLIIAGVVPPRPALLIMGIAAYVAASVMVEARRLADDSASIV